jgi:arylsulfatase A-like enzyme
MDRVDLEHVIALYNGEVRFTDDNLSELLQLLDEARPGRQRLTIVTADHGEEFFEHGRKGHQQTLFEESIRVPLIYHWPERLPAGRVVPGQVSLIDIAPTILSLLAVDPMPVTQGLDLSAALSGGEVPDRGLHALLAVGDTRIDAVRTSKYKLLRSNGLFAHLDLISDPRELELLPGPPPNYPYSVQSLEQILQESEILRDRFGDEAIARRLDPEMERRLRALGYIR